MKLSPQKAAEANTRLIFIALSVISNAIVKGLYSLNAIYCIMCFEFEIPNKKKDKNLNMIDEEFEVEPELEKVEEPVTVSVK